MNRKLFGQELKKYRLLLDLTQEELGNHIGMSQQQVGKYENGVFKTKPALEMLLNLQALNQDLFRQVMKEGVELMPHASRTTAPLEISVDGADRDLARLALERKDARMRKINSICTAVDQLDDGQLDQFSRLLLNILSGLSQVNVEDYARLKEKYNS